MINPLDSRMPAFKSYLAEQRLHSGTSSMAKTSIDQSAIGGTEEANVQLNLEAESQNEQEARKKKKEELLALEEANKKEEVVLTDAEIKTRNMRLLIAL